LGFLETDKSDDLCHLPHIEEFMDSRTTLYNKFSVMVWNCQGAGNGQFFNTLHKLLRPYKPKILALVETKISGQHTEEARKRTGFAQYYRVEAQGYRGGIWLLWYSMEVDLRLITSHPQFVPMEVCRGGETPWFFTAVYASPNETLRQELWAKLSSFGCHYDSPWLLAGDFNETKNMEERFNCSEDLSRRCNNFNLWIEINQLIGLGFSGPH